MSKNIKTVPTQDHEEVIATVTKYVEGLRVGSIEGGACPLISICDKVNYYSRRSFEVMFE